MEIIVGSSLKATVELPEALETEPVLVSQAS
jgi:hypothetical protein